MSSGHELQIDYHCDFDLVGLVSAAREYKLAWHINHHLYLNLAKTEDLVIKFVSEPDIMVSNFSCITSHCTFRLLKNRSCDSKSGGYLLPELKNMDYFLIIKNESDTFDSSNCIRKLSDISIITSYQRIDVDKLANKENLLF